jgi:hypothetical protein
VPLCPFPPLRNGVLDVEPLSAQRAHSLRHVHWMNDCNAPITFEVVQIEREDLIHWCTIIAATIRAAWT